MNPEEQLLEEEPRVILRVLLEGLLPLEKEILLKRIEGFELDEIGGLCGHPKTRIQQITARALRKLRYQVCRHYRDLMAVKTRERIERWEERRRELVREHCFRKPDVWHNWPQR